MSVAAWRLQHLDLPGIPQRLDARDQRLDVGQRRCDSAGEDVDLLKARLGRDVPFGDGACGNDPIGARRALRTKSILHLQRGILARILEGPDAGDGSFLALGAAF